MARHSPVTGRYVTTNPNAPKENAGFHWNALCAMSWGRLAELYLRAKTAARKGDVSLIQQFYQKRLALAWREYLEDYRLDIVPGGYLKGETWDGEAGVDAGQRGGEVRDGGPLAFVGAVFDLEDEGVAGPALLQSLAGVPKARGQVFEFLDEDDIVRPAHGKHRLLDGVQLRGSLRHSWSGCG